ncbi:hypothetical protein Athai_13380 [Actinocatenispora thailandica]|uniref:Uncharacterized protein n=1 Tax=Actinocatenispora thailandica TaxID=227318 RepID=A0A7R7DLC1_9ACTN|nr:hypothetical protein Athai_13380 [Actinocatenispora thailandica]
MTHRHPMRDVLHQATHRVPGIVAHAEQLPGHQAATRHGRPRRNPAVQHRSRNRRWNHSPDRPPRVLVGWQARIAAFIGPKQR